MEMLDLTRIFEQPTESLMNYLCKLSRSPPAGCRIVLDSTTLEILVSKLDEKIEILASSPDDADGRMAYDRTIVVHLERLIFLCRFMAHENASFDGCK